MMASNQPAYMRQRFLLSIASRLKGKVSATDMQKAVFLYEQKSSDGFYGFVPYRFGAYSFQLAQDVEILRGGGYLTDKNKLSQEYSPAVYVDAELITELRGDALIKYAYEQHPYYAINSTITKRIFGSADIASIQAEKKLLADNETLFSIGYEGKSIEQFANALLLNSIKLLCDVRRNPVSRNSAFLKAYSPCVQFSITRPSMPSKCLTLFVTKV
ncbi:MAG: DUF488 domain-containing protein [Clostridiales bacterium]|jgi:uncharacterized protein (DUF488 family)|nr:DUF488 domain-containing protein [Clostridiales bacterium]